MDDVSRTTTSGDATADRDYETVFELVSDGLLIHHPETGEILDVNERFCEMHGYEKHELSGLSVAEITADHWTPPSTAREQIQRAREEGDVTFEWCNQEKDGSRLWVEVSLSLVELDGAERVIASVRDISDRKMRQRRIEAVFDHTHQFIGLLDPDGTLVEINQAALDFVDLDRDDVVGEPFWECRWWETSESVQRELVDAIARAADGEFVRYDVEVQGATGTEIIDFSIRPVRNDRGDVVLLVPEGRVITEHREHEQRLEVFDRVYRHTLRNELSIIEGYTDQIRAACPDETVQESAAYIDTASERLEEVGRQTRELDRLKRTDPEFERIDVASVTSALLADAREAHTGVTVRASLAEDLDVHTDRRFLELALENLVENAIEHGDGVVEVSASTADDGAGVDITVADDGPGIPQDEIEPIVQGSVDQLEHSTGLGLWIVKWSVDELDAELVVESDDDGATVSVRLPTNPW